MKQGKSIEKVFWIPLEFKLIPLPLTHCVLAIHLWLQSRSGYHSPRFDSYLAIELNVLLNFSLIEFLPLLAFYLVARARRPWGIWALRANVFCVSAIHAYLAAFPNEFEGIQWFFVLTLAVACVCLILLSRTRPLDA